jgi:hypothetical protein
MPATPRPTPAPAGPAPGRWGLPLPDRIRAAFEATPTLCLTVPHAQRLWGVSMEACAEALADCVETGYLRETPRGFVRA